MLGYIIFTCRTGSFGRTLSPSLQEAQTAMIKAFTRLLQHPLVPVSMLAALLTISGYPQVSQMLLSQPSHSGPTISSSTSSSETKTSSPREPSPLPPVPTRQQIPPSTWYPGKEIILLLQDLGNKKDQLFRFLLGLKPRSPDSESKTTSTSTPPVRSE